MKKNNKQKFIELANKLHNNKYGYSEVEYNGCKNKVKIICPEHGIFEMTPDCHINGKNGCPKCSGKVFCNEDAIYKFKKIHGDKYDYSKVEYINAYTKVTIICPEHGEFKQTPHNHLNGNGCPKCGRIKNSKSKTLTSEVAIDNIKKRTDDKYDLSKAKYVNAKTKIKVICHQKDINGIEHGEFEITPSNLLSGYGCPKCSKEKNSIQSRLPYDVFQKKVNEKYGNIYIIDKDTYENKPYEFNVYCTIHKIYFKCNGYNLYEYKNNICPECQKDMLLCASIKTHNISDIEICEQPKMDESILYKIKSGEEVWVPVWGLENKYMVSSNGRIKRINRIYKNGKKLEDRLIRQYYNSRNRRTLGVTLNGKYKTVHKTVFESFYKLTIPKGYEYTIDHIDTNPDNNNVLNLRLCKGIRDNMLNNPLTIKHLNRKGHKQNLNLDITNLDGEIWVPCIGYEDIYSISNKGRIKAEERIIVERNTGIIRKKKPHIMRMYKKDNMYYTVGLTDKNGNRKNIYVHKIEYESFFGKIEEGNEVDHIDSNPLNNNLDNLRSCSHKENCMNINSINKRYNTIKKNNKRHNGISLLLMKNNEIIKEFASYIECAEYFGVGYHSIERYINKKTTKLRCLSSDLTLIKKQY